MLFIKSSSVFMILKVKEGEKKDSQFINKEFLGHHVICPYCFTDSAMGA